MHALHTSKTFPKRTLLGIGNSAVSLPKTPEEGFNHSFIFFHCTTALTEGENE